MQATPHLRARIYQRAAGRCRPVCQASIAAEPKAKHRVVFLGTPDVAAIVLKELVAASRQPASSFEVVAVVSQPGKPRGRGNKSMPLPTPVQEAASELGLQDLVLAPATARDTAFLEALTSLQPDLCVTAAYGNMLPQKFLDLPRWGTLNIHPSLLPKYRGAAPVQRCLQSGDTVAGVSVAYTVLKCDAGPVLAQQQVPIDPNIQAPELLEQLFRQGVALLLQHLPDVLAGKAAERAVPQDESQVTHADKLRKEDAILDFTKEDALTLHNSVRGLAGWPGTVGHFLIQDESGANEPLDLRIMRTCWPTQADVEAYQAAHAGAAAGGHVPVGWTHDGDMLVPCAHAAGEAAHTDGRWAGSVLRVTTVQPPTKKAMAARDFRNGLRKKHLLVPVPAATSADKQQQSVPA